MKNSELRIGNWITFDGLEAQVIAIPDGDFYEDKKFKPIPITEEWLANFGIYEYDRMGDLIYLSFKEIEKFDFNFCLFKFQLSVTIFRQPWTNSIEIYDVHSLQNLYFALTGKELQMQ